MHRCFEYLLLRVLLLDFKFTVRLSHLRVHFKWAVLIQLLTGVSWPDRAIVARRIYSSYFVKKSLPLG